VPVGTSLIAVAIFLGLGLGAVAWIFKTGWRLRN
jgi:ABC-2 type transport system permease protein